MGPRSSTFSICGRLVDVHVSHLRRVDGRVSRDVVVANDVERDCSSSGGGRRRRHCHEWRAWALEGAVLMETQGSDAEGPNSGWVSAWHPRSTNTVHAEHIYITRCTALTRAGRHADAVEFIVQRVALAWSLGVHVWVWMTDDRSREEIQWR